MSASAVSRGMVEQKGGVKTNLCVWREEEREEKRGDAMELLCRQPPWQGCEKEPHHMTTPYFQLR